MGTNATLDGAVEGFQPTPDGLDNTLQEIIRNRRIDYNSVAGDLEHGYDHEWRDGETHREVVFLGAKALETFLELFESTESSDQLGALRSLLEQQHPQELGRVNISTRESSSPARKVSAIYWMDVDGEGDFEDYWTLEAFPNRGEGVSPFDIQVKDYGHLQEAAEPHGIEVRERNEYEANTPVYVWEVD